jgi:RNA polymerase subunit RPABC4/transcription elongation factor Spt4
MDYIGQIGAAIGTFLANPALHLIAQGIAIYVAVLWLAASYWAFRDMQLRTENPILPYLASAFIIVSSPVLFWASLIVYRIIRPQERIGEVNERMLAEEAMLVEVEAVESCPTCARRINDEWIICPTCRTRLRRVCPNCSRLVGLDWSLCAWCGKDFERRPAAVAVTPLPDATSRPAAIEPPAAMQVPEPARPVRRTGTSRRAVDPLPER